MHPSSIVVVILFLHAFPADASGTCLRDPSVNRATVLDAVKQEILLRLGLLEDPKNPKNVSEIFADPQFLKEYDLMKANQKLSEVHTPCANLDFLTRETLRYTPKEVQRRRPLRNIATGDDCASDLSVDFYNVYTVKFDIDLSNREYVTDAQLRLVKLPFESGNVQASRIDLFMVTQPENYFNEELFRHIGGEVHYSDSINGLAVFNVSSAIIRWLEAHPTSVKDEIKFEVRIRCTHPLTHSFIPNVQLFEESSQGLLVLTTYKDINVNYPQPTSAPGPARFKREDINDGLTFCGPTEVHCCLTRFRIDFVRDFNWTWVYPRDIAFNYCGGECPRRWQLSTLHAAFMDFFRAGQNPTAAPEPCCVPNSYESLTLGLYLNGKKTFDYLQDLVATSCACR